ncbi:hypothetical protein, partial [Mesorhizobium sp. M6A.T.Cr.TU.017.01.1.1]|uniref:hypothetical protein n=1 Tax=Mesorhizobium sp. M6A.T.Cr.TU.017.01.1.1 TaxID=2496774 RepID=UPI0019D4C306
GAIFPWQWGKTPRPDFSRQRKNSPHGARAGPLARGLGKFAPAPLLTLNYRLEWNVAIFLVNQNEQVAP